MFSSTVEEIFYNNKAACILYFHLTSSAGSWSLNSSILLSVSCTTFSAWFTASTRSYKNPYTIGKHSQYVCARIHTQRSKYRNKTLQQESIQICNLINMRTTTKFGQIKTGLCLLSQAIYNSQISTSHELYSIKIQTLIFITL